MAEIKTIIRADSTQHDSTVKKSANEIYKYQKKVDTAKKSLSTMVSTVGKFAGALGIAVSAGALFAKGLKDIEGLNDSVAEKQRITNTVINDFFTSIKNGSFQNFLDGLRSIIDDAGEAYKALDKLGTFKSFSSRDLAQNTAEQAKASYNIKALKAGIITPEEAGGTLEYWQNFLETLQTKRTGIINHLLTEYDDAINKMEKEIFSKWSSNPRFKEWMNTYTGDAFKNEFANDIYSAMKEEKEAIDRALSTAYDVKRNMEKDPLPGYDATGKYNEALANSKKFYETFDKELFAFLGDLTDKEKKITEKNAVELEKFNTQADEWNKAAGKIKDLKTGGSGGSGGKGNSSNLPTYEEGSLDWFDAQIKALQDLINSQKLSAEELKNIQNQISELEQQKLEYVQSLRGGKLELIPELKPISTEQALEGLKIIKTEVQEIKQEFIDLNAVSSAFGETASAIGSIFNSLGEIAGETDGQMLKMFADISGHISNMLPKIFSLIAANEGEALAAGTASASSLPFPYNLAAIASVVAELVAVFATISSYSGKFAEGGIVGGSSTIGDYNLARVNKGEMILNGKQQAHLFNMLNGIGVPSNNGVSGNVVFRISGNDLVGTLNNYNKRVGRVK